MAFKIKASPHQHSRSNTGQLMRLVMLAALPGMFAQWVFFGWGNLLQIAITALTAVTAEAAVLWLRGRPLGTTLSDCSALLTGILLGIALPPLAPWWIGVIGCGFAVVVAKQLYGGLGNNLFNPAMIAYVLLLISFPVQMTSWLPVQQLAAVPVSLADAFSVIFSGFSEEGFSAAQLALGIDGTTMATPLDTLKTSLTQGQTSGEIMDSPVYSWLAGAGWEWVNIGFLVGGLWLLKRRVIQWQIPLSMLASLTLVSLLVYLVQPDSSASPLLHLFSGASMFGAFFIATDPVSASTTRLGRLIYGAFIGFLVYVIRTWGGYPDAVAFAVLLANVCVPLIDYYTRPATYGTRG